MSSAHQTYLAQKHFSCLDGIRFICIMAVIWHHTPGSGLYTTITQLFARGHVGVDFFFVLSGFLITTLLLREDKRTGRISLSGFYTRRALRIIPLYFLVVSVAAFNDIVLNGERDKLEILPYYYLFLANFIRGEDITFLAPTWSLSVEEQYYLIWPLLLIFLPRRTIVPTLIALIAWNIAAVLDWFAFIGITGFQAGPLYFAIGGATYAPILLGSLAAVILNSKSGFDTAFRSTTFPLASWAFFVGLIVALQILPPVLEGWPNLIVHSLMAIMLVSVVVKEDNSMSPVLRLRPIVRIGQISYGIYLYHTFARGVTVPLLNDYGITSLWAHFISYFALSLIVSEISFRTYEKWFLDLRRRT